ncbi:wat1-related protein [Quercus suber]|uniref:Wat1-related protein n=1 Tax=Quercus suber TaxID=58331 RepID=A0AAW0KCU3_QUESU
MTAFKPLSSLITVIMGLLILGDALYKGVIGATLIILGLYATLWGEVKEKAEKQSEQTMSEQGIEIKQEKQLR